MRTYLWAILCMATWAGTCQETNTWTSGRPDGHAPIMVMGDHMHGRGEWMFSYRYMHMKMDGLRRGNNDAETADALADYMATPVAMPMDMHMLGAMFAPSDKLTLMAMLNYLSMDMRHTTRMGGSFTTEASGFGDIQLTAIVKLLSANRQILHGQLGISIPSGSIEESDITPASAPNSTTLPYPMQLGSGTWDATVGLTYLGQADSWSWGSQGKAVLRLGQNSRDYRYGNRLDWNNWLAVKAASWLSFSARLEGLIIGEIHGADPKLNPMMVITADTQNSGGSFINGGLGFNTYVPSGPLKNIRVGFEVAFPLAQDVHGIQLKTKTTLVSGIQYSF